MLILFDHGTPRSIARWPHGHTIVEAIEKGWDRLSNGALLKAAEEAGFDLLLSTEKKSPVPTKSQKPAPCHRYTTQTRNDQQCTVTLIELSRQWTRLHQAVSPKWQFLTSKRLSNCDYLCSLSMSSTRRRTSSLGRIPVEYQARRRARPC